MRLRFIGRMLKYVMVLFGIIMLIAGTVGLWRLLKNGIADISSLEQLESKEVQYVNIKTELMDTGISVTNEDSDNISSYFYYTVLDGKKILIWNDKKLDLSAVSEITGITSIAVNKDRDKFYELQAKMLDMKEDVLCQQYSEVGIKYSSTNPYVYNIITTLVALFMMTLGAALIYNKHRAKTVSR